jgi:hypothetical protein
MNPPRKPAEPSPEEPQKRLDAPAALEPEKEEARSTEHQSMGRPLGCPILLLLGSTALRAFTRAGFAERAMVGTPEAYPTAGLAMAVLGIVCLGWAILQDTRRPVGRGAAWLAAAIALLIAAGLMAAWQ